MTTTTSAALKVLLVGPETPYSYWGFQYGVWFMGAKASLPPLPLITVPALLPQHWEFRLVDLNFQRLRDDDIAWADYVLLTGMVVQKDSMQAVLKRCLAADVPTVVGGPFASSYPDAPELKFASSVVIGELEVEQLIRSLVYDMEQGDGLQRRYKSTDKPLMACSPVPRFDLLQRRAYCSVAIQVNRGCPYRCEFCNVRQLFGEHSRCKSPAQVVAELDAIYATGHYGNIFIVDDNFSGNPKKAVEVLRAIISWQEAHGFPFLFYTQVDIGLGSTKKWSTKMRKLMVQAGFFAVFIGFETTSQAALAEVGKRQNLGVDQVAAVQRLRRSGLLVFGGYIVGFDHDELGSFDPDDMDSFDPDNPGSFVRAKAAIDACAIDFAMVGMLIAFPGTELYERLKAEGRLVQEAGVDQFGITNMVPRQMSSLELVRGFRWMLEELYSPRQFFSRAYTAITEWKQVVRRRVTWREYLAVPRSLIRQGIFSTYSLLYWWFMLRVLFHDPRKIPRGFAMAISGHHFFLYTRNVVAPRLKRAEERLNKSERAGRQTAS